MSAWDPSGSGWFEDGPGKAPRPSNGWPTWPSGNPGLSCNWNDSPREEMNFPPDEESWAPAPRAWSMALHEDWAAGSSPCWPRKQNQPCNQFLWFTWHKWWLLIVQEVPTFHSPTSSTTLNGLSHVKFSEKTPAHQGHIIIAMDPGYSCFYGLLPSLKND